MSRTSSLSVAMARPEGKEIMPTSLAGATNRIPLANARGSETLTLSRDREGAVARSQRGVTLLEMMIVVTLIALVAGLSHPSVSSGVDSLRLRSASDAIVAFLNTALDRADRRQQVVEIWISPHDNAMIARSADSGFVRRLDVPDPIRIISVQPQAPSGPDEPRRFLC